MLLTQHFWEKAYSENAPKLVGVCRRYVMDREVAEDLMHDSFVTAISKSDSYTGKGSFEAWLRKIAVNTSLMYLRQKNSQKINADLLLNESEYQTMDESNVEKIRSAIEQADFSDTELLEVIDHLPEHHKLVFNLYVIDNYTHVQISKELNISSGTSKSHLARARKKIQHLLYQKAVEKSQVQKKKKRVALFLLIFSKSNYIDKLFKDRFSNFSIDHFIQSNRTFDRVDWVRVKIPRTKSVFFTPKTNYWILGSSFGLLFFVGVFTSRNSSNQLNVSEYDSTRSKNINTIIHPIDTHTANIKTDNKIEINNSENEKPVIIKKTIIQRKTITIRDTIRIIDSTNAH